MDQILLKLESEFSNFEKYVFWIQKENNTEILYIKKFAGYLQFNGNQKLVLCKINYQEQSVYFGVPLNVAKHLSVENQDIQTTSQHFQTIDQHTFTYIHEHANKEALLNFAKSNIVPVMTYMSKNNVFLKLTVWAALEKLTDITHCILFPTELHLLSHDTQSAEQPEASTWNREND